MTTHTLTSARGVRGMAGSALRWFTAFDPFGPYAAVQTRSRRV